MTKQTAQKISTAVDKITAVIYSCKNEEQIDTACNMAVNFSNLFKIDYYEIYFRDLIKMQKFVLLNK